jgi:CubicO group peptidase (beta-lactamase class C family)
LSPWSPLQPDLRTQGAANACARRMRMYHTRLRAAIKADTARRVQPPPPPCCQAAAGARRARDTATAKQARTAEICAQRTNGLPAAPMSVSSGAQVGGKIIMHPMCLYVPCPVGLQGAVYACLSTFDRSRRRVKSRSGSCSHTGPQARLTLHKANVTRTEKISRITSFSDAFTRMTSTKAVTLSSGSLRVVQGRHVAGAHTYVVARHQNTVARDRCFTSSCIGSRTSSGL